MQQISLQRFTISALIAHVVCAVESGVSGVVGADEGEEELVDAGVGG
jgi:hypothetical protein